MYKVMLLTVMLASLLPLCAAHAPRALASGISASPDTGASGAGSGAVMIRVANRSDVNFDKVLVKFPSQTEDYGPVSAHAKTEYRRIAKAYRYAYVEVLAAGQKGTLQPIDYAGEIPLAAGRYTYAITYHSVGGGHGRVELSLTQD